MEEGDNKRCSDRGQARKAEGVRRLSRQKDHERTSRQRKRSSRSSTIAGSLATHSGDWHLAPPFTAVEQRERDSVSATGTKLGISICEPHIFPCGKQVESSDIHGLSCHHSVARVRRHNMVNDVVCRTMQRAKIPAATEPPGILRSDNKRPDGGTLIP